MTETTTDEPFEAVDQTLACQFEHPVTGAECAADGVLFTVVDLGSNGRANLNPEDERIVVCGPHLPAVMADPMKDFPVYAVTIAQEPA